MKVNDFPATAGSTAEIHSYTELRQRIHNDLRVQHPEWVKSNGDCPTCEAYEQRLAESIDRFRSGRSNLAAV